MIWSNLVFDGRSVPPEFARILKKRIHTFGIFFVVRLAIAFRYTLTAGHGGFLIDREAFTFVGARCRAPPVRSFGSVTSTSSVACTNSCRRLVHYIFRARARRREMSERQDGQQQITPYLPLWPLPLQRFFSIFVSSGFGRRCKYVGGSFAYWALQSQAVYHTPPVHLVRVCKVCSSVQYIHVA